MGRFEWSLDDLTDHGDAPDWARPSRANDGVNFGNFAADGDAPDEASTGTSGE